MEPWLSYWRISFFQTQFLVKEQVIKKRIACFRGTAKQTFLYPWSLLLCFFSFVNPASEPCQRSPLYSFVTTALSTLVMFPANAVWYEREIRGFVFLSSMDLCACEMTNWISDLTNLINIKCWHFWLSERPKQFLRFSFLGTLWVSIYPYVNLQKNKKLCYHSPSKTGCKKAEVVFGRRSAWFSLVF